VKNSIPIHLGQQNLAQVSRLLSKIKHFVFFGTLLGLVRDRNIIDGDDDIDLYVDINHRKEVINILTDSGYLIDFAQYPNTTPYFIQATTSINNIAIPTDFYFFEDDGQSKYILERWNFLANVEDKTNHLLIPKDLLFPLQTKQFFGADISLPAKPEALCRYLYGKHWLTPLKKEREYRTLVINNKPMVLTGFHGRIAFKVLRSYRKRRKKFKQMMRGS